MGVRPKPLHHGRWWDATLNVVGGCKLADDSCYFCYAPRDAAGVQTATDIELYLGTTVWKDGRWTWNGKLTPLPPEHPKWTFPLRWTGAAEPLLGPSQPSLLWINSMADLFSPGRPVEHFHRLMETVAISHHIGLVPTKYPAAMVEYFQRQPAWWRRRFWLGFSAGDQRWWDVRWKIMRPLAKQGWTIFTSIAPMLTPVILPPDFLELGAW